MKKKDFKKNAAELFITTPADQEPGQDAAPDPEQIEGDPYPATVFNIPTGYRLVKEKKSERLQVLIRPNTKDALKKEAAAQGVSVNDLVNIIIEEYIERERRG